MKTVSPGPRRRIDAAALSRLFQQLALAHRSQLPLAEAVTIALQDTDADPKVQRFLRAVSADLSQGISLSDALERTGAGFAPETLGLVRAAQEGPELGSVLEMLAADYDIEARLRSAVRAALAWPTFSFVVLLIVGSLVATFAIPQFESMFASFGAELPGPTRLVVALSNLFGKGWIVVIPLLVLAVWWLRSNDVVAWWLDGRLGAAGVRTPIVRTYLARAFTSRISTLLVATLEGAPLRESLAHLRATLGHAGWASRVTQLEERLASGLALPEAVVATPSLPARLRVAVELGNRTQRLETALRHAVAVSEDELGRSLLRLEQALLVTGYIAVGLMVAFVIVALYLPIFKMGSVI